MKPALFYKFSMFACFLALSIFAGKANAQYCTPTYFQGCLTNVEINDFSLIGAGGSSISDLATGCTSSGTLPVTCYRDMHASMSVTLNPATTYTVVSTTATLNILPTGLQIFIDFNDDGTFDPSTESVGGGAYTVAGLSTNFVITIPSGAASGSHRLRAVASGDLAYPSIIPCPSYSLTGGTSLTGEVHDYTAVIGAASATCDTPTSLTVTSITSTSAVLNWTEPAGSVGSEYVVTTISGTPTGAGTATTGLTYNATSLTPSTTYYASVRDSCGAASLSGWVTRTFTTTATSTNVNKVASNDFSITTFPNPVKEMFTIRINGAISETGYIGLMDISGKMLKTIVADATTLNISTSDMPAGVYLVRYTDAKHTQTIRISKQ